MSGIRNVDRVHRSGAHLLKRNRAIGNGPVGIIDESLHVDGYCRIHYDVESHIHHLERPDRGTAELLRILVVGIELDTPEPVVDGPGRGSIQVAEILPACPVERTRQRRGRRDACSRLLRVASSHTEGTLLLHHHTLRHRSGVLLIRELLQFDYSRGALHRPLGCNGPGNGHKHC